MRQALKLVVCLLPILCFSTGCFPPKRYGDKSYPPHTHYYNPLRWGAHVDRLLNPWDGEIQDLFISMDRVFFGVENYEEFEQTEMVYTLR